MLLLSPMSGDFDVFVPHPHPLGPLRTNPSKCSLLSSKPHCRNVSVRMPLKAPLTMLT